MGGTFEFEFKRVYKSKVAIHQTTLGILRIQLLHYQVGMAQCTCLRENPQFGKLSMEDKGKTINLEIDDEEEDLQAFIQEMKVDEEMEEEIQLVRTSAKLPNYVPP